MSDSEDSSTHATGAMNDRIELIQKAITDMGNTFRNYIEFQTHNGNQSGEGIGHNVEVPEQGVNGYHS